VGSAPNFVAYRGTYGAQRPEAIDSLKLPPAKAPLLQGTRPRKVWRYVAIHAESLQICAAKISIGPLDHVFWAIWDRETQTVHEGKHNWDRGVEMPDGRLLIHDKGIEAEFALAEVAGVETVTPVGNSWTWTRKQGGINATGFVRLNGKDIQISAPAIIDDSAGFHARQTDWLWCSGVGTNTAGQAVAWNFVNGINDDPAGSEQTVWVDGAAHAVDPLLIATDLSHVRFADQSQLDFHQESVRGHKQNLVLLKSQYSQPFGTFSGDLPHAGRLKTGLGVMESHSALW